MPPRAVFNRDVVLEAALALVDERGWRGLTARTLAQRLGASTAPVYHHFNTMEALSQAVLTRARDLMLSYAVAPHTDNIFLNMGVGIAYFARDHKQLFRALYLEEMRGRDIPAEVEAVLLPRLAQDARLAALPDDVRVDLLHKMGIFTIGLATMISVGLLHDTSDQAIVRTLAEVGAPVVGTVLAAKPGDPHGHGGAVKSQDGASPVEGGEG